MVPSIGEATQGSHQRSLQCRLQQLKQKDFSYGYNFGFLNFQFSTEPRLSHESDKEEKEIYFSKNKNVKDF